MSINFCYYWLKSIMFKEWKCSFSWNISQHCEESSPLVKDTVQNCGNSLRIIRRLMEIFMSIWRFFGIFYARQKQLQIGTFWVHTQWNWAKSENTEYISLNYKLKYKPLTWSWLLDSWWYVSIPGWSDRPGPHCQDRLDTVRGQGQVLPLPLQ